MPTTESAIDARDAQSYGAVELFVARARAVDRDFTLKDGNVGQVVSICAALDGMALAIELAAARLPMLGLGGFLGRLDAGNMRTDEMQKLLRPDLDNARAALAWAVENDHEIALALAGTMSTAMDLPMYRDAVGVWALVDFIFDSPTLAKVPAVVSGRAAERCAIHWQNTRSQHAVVRARQAVDLLCGEGTPRALYVALAALTIVSARTRDGESAAEAMQALRAIEDPWWPAGVRLFSAEAHFHVALERKNYGEAKRQAEIWLQLARRPGAHTGAAENNVLDVAIADGHPEQAVREGNELLAYLRGTRRLNDVAYVTVNVAAGYLFLGNTAEAREVAREGWRLAPLFDLQGPWADYFALVAALEGRMRTACLMLGYPDARYESAALRRYGNEARAADRAVALAAEKLSEEEIARLREQARSLDDAEVTELAFEETDRHENH